MAEIKNQKEKKEDYKIELEQIIQAGLGFGHRTSRLHPKMQSYIAKAKDTVHIIDLEKTAQNLKEALKLIEKFILEGKTILLVGTKPHLKSLVEETAKACGLPYVKERWIGGTFTNFEEIKKRIKYFKELEAKIKEEEFEKKYTKKERQNFLKELERLKIKFEGIKDMEKLPEAVFVADLKKEILSVKEARKKGIKVIAIADTDVDPTLADYPIPANDDAISSVKYILDKIKEVTKSAKSKAQSEK